MREIKFLSKIRKSLTIRPHSFSLTLWNLEIIWIIFGNKWLETKYANILIISIKKKKENLSLICLTTIIFITILLHFKFYFKSYWFDKWNKITSIVVFTIFVTFPFYYSLLHFSHIIEQIRQRAERLCRSIISIIRVKKKYIEFSCSSFNEHPDFPFL